MFILKQNLKKFSEISFINRNFFRSIKYRIYSRIGRNFFLIFFNKKHGCDLSARHTLKVFGYCKYRIFRLISRCRHELRLRLCSHIPMRDSFMRAHAHATAKRALDFPALLRKNGFAILMFDFEVICFKFILIFEVYFNFRTANFENLS